MTFSTVGACVPVRSKPDQTGARMEVLGFCLSTGEFVARLPETGALYVCRGVTDERGAFYEIVREYHADDLAFLLTLPKR